MPSFNKIIIVGYIGRDAQLHEDSEGTARCSFPVAINEWCREAGGQQRRTTWFRICITGYQAEYFSIHLTKGMQVYVEGHLTQRTYSDRSGAQRISLDVRATDLQVLQGTSEKFISPTVVTYSDGRDVDESLLPL